MSKYRVDMEAESRENKMLQRWEDQIQSAARSKRSTETVTRSTKSEQSGDSSRSRFDSFAKSAPEQGNVIYRPSREAEAVVQVEGLPEPQEERESPSGRPQGGQEAEEAQSGDGTKLGTYRTTVEGHCFCDGGKHNKETGTDCYMVITEIIGPDGKPVSSPEIGKRQPYRD